MVKTLAIDPGLSRVGLAACDELEISTRLLPVLPASDPQVLVQSLADLIEQEAFEKVLIGNPLHMDGKISPGSRRSVLLQKALEADLQKRGWTGELALYDERLTSFEAELRLRQKGLVKKKSKAFLDSVAALVLLEDYLASQASARGGVSFED